MDVHLATVPTRVRQQAIGRHAAMFDERLGLILISAAGGPPALWKRGCDRVTAAFGAALGRPDPARCEVQVREAFQAARGALLSFREVLIGTGPDVMLLSIVLLGPHAVVAVAGAGRVYLQQGTLHKRLTAFEDRTGGLLDNTEPWIASTPLHPGDLLLAGSLEAFELPAIGAVASRLQTEPGAGTKELVDMLLQPARESGVGAAAAAVRI